MLRRLTWPSWWRGRAMREPQPYRLQCDCGAELSGVRSSRLERIGCPHCGRASAVLPRNPRPRPPEPSQKGRRALGRWRQSGAPGSRSDAPAARRSATEATPDSARQATPIGDRLEGLRNLARRAAAAALRPITLPRLLAAGVALLLLATLGWSWHSSRRTALERRLNESLDAGAEALETGRIPEALVALRTAADAARDLGVVSPEARRAVHLQREAQAWSSLSLNSLEGWLLETRDRDDAERSRRDFARTFAGKTAVFEGWLMPPSGGAAGDAPPRTEFDWALASGPATLELSLPSADLESGDADAPQLIVFAAQLADVACVEPGRWQLRLAPESLVLLSEKGPLVKAGRPADAELDAALARQRARLGIEAAP